MKPISVQLYSLREEAAQGMLPVLQRLATIGYQGVEPAGFFDLTPQSFRTAVEDLGMKVSSTHSPWASADNLSEVIDTCGILGVDLTACGYGPDDFATVAAIEKTAETTRQMHETLAASGITLVVHNHQWEFEKIDGRLKHEIFTELCPDVQLELDTYWSANFGANDPAAMTKQFADRSPLLHIKDGSLVKDAPLLSVGAGKIDVPAVIAAMNPDVTRWLVVEQDNSETDMFECIEASYRYLTTNGLAAGDR